MRSPKERFLESSFAGQWGKICASEAFDEAIHAALNELHTHMPMDCQVPQQACDAHQQMVGARKFIDILSTIYVKETTNRVHPVQGLNYTAGV